MAKHRREALRVVRRSRLRYQNNMGVRVSDGVRESECVSDKLLFGLPQYTQGQVQGKSKAEHRKRTR